MERCQCDEAKPWEDARGKQTNVCQGCGGKIKDHARPDLGLLHHRLDSALLGDHKLDTDHPFITYIAETIREDIRQKKLTWDNNRLIEQREKASVKPT